MPSVDGPFNGWAVIERRSRSHLPNDGGNTFRVAAGLRRRPMIKKSKLAVIATLAVLGLASPALAQSFDPDSGTGNTLAFSYGTVSTGNHQRVATQNSRNHPAIAQSGETTLRPGALYDYAGPSSAAESGRGANDLSLAGGGSSGYNQNLYNY
jgi:hypothetical protein